MYQRLYGFGSWYLLILVLVSCRGKPREKREVPLPILVSGVSQRAVLQPDGSQDFQLPTILPGHYCEITVLQDGMDLRFSIGLEKGKWEFEANFIAMPSGSEFYAFIAEKHLSNRKLSVWSDFPQAHGSYEVLVTIRPPTDSDLDLANAFEHFADGVRNATVAGESLPVSLSDFKKSAALFQALGYSVLAGQGIEGVGRILDLMGENTESLVVRTENLARQESAEDVLGQAQSHYGLGRIYTSTGDIKLSITHYKQGLALSREIQSLVLEGMIEHNLGELLLDLGELSEASRLLADSMHTFEEIDDKHKMAIEMVALSEVTTEMGNDAEAVELLRDAGKLFRKLHLIWDLGHVQQKRANLQMRAFPLGSDSTGTVSAILNEAISLSRESGDLRGELGALSLLGRHLQITGRPKDALEVFSQALSFAKKMGERVQEPSILRGLGTSALMTGDAKQARSYLGTALTMARGYHLPIEEAQILVALARVDQRLGQVADALSNAKAAIDVLESIRFRIVSGEDRTTYFNLVRPFYDLYIELLMMDPTTGGEEAFFASEQARARSLVEALITQSEQHVSAEVLRERRIAALRLSNAEHAAALLRASSGDNREALTKAESLIATRYRDYQEYVTTPASALNRSETGKAHLQQLRETLPTGTLLIEFAVTDKRVYGWSLDKEEFQSFDLGESELLRSKVSKIRNLLKDSHAIHDQATQERLQLELSAVAADVSDMLLKPLLAGREASQLAIVPDGVLLGLPFSLLRDPRASVQTDATWLSDSFGLMVMPAAALMSRGPAKRKWSKEVAVLADPVFSSGDGRVRSPTPGDSRFARLRFSQLEADAIEKLVPSAMVATGFAANQQLVLSGALASYRIVHLATHAVIDNRHPELSSIVLSQVHENGSPVDGLLRLHEIYSLGLSAELVVLSACETALGKEIRGEGFIGLTRAFLVGGASAVMASQWRVEDQATARLMELFYGALLHDNLSPVLALQRAQATMREDTRWKSPYYWASFQIVAGSLETFTAPSTR